MNYYKESHHFHCHGKHGNQGLVFIFNIKLPLLLNIFLSLAINSTHQLKFHE